VGDFQRKYSGEQRFPLILQNLHRFFMYGALVFVPLLWYGAIKGFHHPDGKPHLLPQALQHLGRALALEPHGEGGADDEATHPELLLQQGAELAGPQP
jgi:hypothetical protein